MKQAATRMKSNTDNPLVIAQCEQSLVDAGKRIDYLQKELERLQRKEVRIDRKGISNLGGNFVAILIYIYMIILN